MKVLVVSLLCLVSARAQRMFKAKFEDCGSVLNIADARQGPVKLSAVFNRKTKRHIFLRGQKVSICIDATVPSSIPLPVMGAGLKNQAHGEVIAPIPVPLKVPFCDLQIDACVGAKPACPNIQPGNPVTLCSEITVPAASPNVDVEITWKVLRENITDTNCESEFSVDALRNKGKLALACLTIPASIKDKLKGQK